MRPSWNKNGASQASVHMTMASHKQPLLPSAGSGSAGPPLPTLPGPHPLHLRILSALFFAITSILIVFTNKIILTNFGFPSFLILGAGQMSASMLILLVGRAARIVSFPACSREIPAKIFPLPAIFALNLLSGLGGTQKLNLPMFTVMRRFSILLTMLGEYLLLRIVPTYHVQIAVALMILGAAVAAANDLAFDALGYTLIAINDICTAAYGVYMKEKLDARAGLGQYGILFYNAAFMLPFAAVLAAVSGDLEKAIHFERWGSGVFVAAFSLSCVCGFILNYAVVLCTHYNSPLTTACVGAMKNIVVTYVGMISSGDYKYSPWNFGGITISVVGSLIYSWVTFVKPKATLTSPPPEKVTTKSTAAGP